MPDNDLHLFAREVHGYLTEQCITRPADEKARRLRDVAWSILANSEPILFAWCAPGFLLIGDRQNPGVFPDPHLAGLADAWEIFLSGPTVGSILSSADLSGAPSGKALRGRLEHAATWLEGVARCPALAKALRSPSIIVGRDGGIEYNLANHRPLILQL